MTFSRHSGNRPRDYGVAVLLTAVALMVSLLFHPVFEPNPFLLFFVTTSVSTYLGGIGPGIVSIVLAIIGIEVFFVNDIRGFDDLAIHLLRLGLFAGAAGFTATLNSRLRAAREQEAEARHQLDLSLRTASEVLESISDAFFAVDKDWRLTYVNKRAESLWTFPREELLGRQMWDVFPQKIGSYAYNQYVAAMNDRQPRQFEAVSVLTHGWQSVSVYPTESGLSAYFRDIQEQKQQEAMRDFLIRASAVLTASLDYRTTLAKVAELATPAIADWCAVDILEPDQTIKRLAVTHSDPYKVAAGYAIHQDYSSDLNAATGVGAILRTGHYEYYPLITDEMLAANVKSEEDLALFRELGFRSAIVVPLVARSRIVGAITLVTTTDSGRQLYENDVQMALELGQIAGLTVDNARLYYEAERQREQLLVTLTSIGDAVISTDSRGNVTFINPEAEKLTGWSAEEARGHQLSEVYRIVNEETRQPIDNPVSQLLRASGDSSAGQHKLIVSREGADIPIEESGAPIRDSDGDTNGVVLVFRDISQRRAVERARAELLQQEQLARRNAEAANELKLKFLAMISHELRTPLTSIKGFTSTLLASDVDWDAKSQREFLTIMDQEADRLTDLVEQLLDVSRLQAGALRIVLQPDQLIEAVNAAMAQLSALTTDYHLDILFPADLPALLFDRQRIAQVLVNLVGNAVKFAPPGTTITISAQQRESVVQVDVSDEGEGIPEGQHHIIFEAFRQGERAGARQQGAGLGLAICKGIVDAHNGDIWIADNPGRGATISFTLQVASDSADTHPPPVTL